MPNERPCTCEPCPRCDGSKHDPQDADSACMNCDGEGVELCDWCLELEALPF